MSLQVNFSTHSKAIQASYKAVLDGDDSVNWVVYSYDKGTNDLKVLAQGGGGLEELAEEFNDGKIQYAFARVIDPNTELSKFVLVSWCGSGVPESRKGLFNSHLDDVSRFLKGYHVQINARSESDVDPSYIMKRVNESSGSKYSIHKEAPRPVEKPTPVNSVYKRTEIPDIAAMQRAAMQKEPAPTPVNSVYQRTLTAPKPLGQRWGTQQQQQEQGDRERIEREAADRAAREREERERDQRSRVDQDRLQRQRDEQAQRQREQDEESERQRRQQEDERRKKQQEEESERRRRQQEEESEKRRRQQEEEESERRMQQEEESDRLRKQQAAEEERLYNQQAEEEERARYEAEEQARIEQEQADREREEERQRLEQQRLEEELDATAARAAATAEQNAKAIVEPKGTTGSQNAVVLFAYDAAEANEMSLIEGEIITNIEQVDEGWWTATSEDGTRSGLFPANYVQLLEESTPSEIVPETIVELEAPEIPEVPAAPLEDQGQTAVALYEYVAAEDNEITFRENDIITQIEFSSDDWWQGTAPNGLIGLFPSNYVELRQ